MFGSLLVDISLAVMLLLVELVADGITSGLGTGAEGGIAVLGHVLVGLLGSSGTGALNGLGDVVGGVPRRLMLVTWQRRAVRTRCEHT